MLKVVWPGAETIEDGMTALGQNRTVQIELPDSYHHALFARLRPGAQEMIVTPQSDPILTQINTPSGGAR